MQSDEFKRLSSNRYLTSPQMESREKEPPEMAGGDERFALLWRCDTPEVAMKRLYAMTLAGLLCAATGAASADSISLNSVKPQFLPVLVQVNSAGKVTDASPAVELPVPIMRLLRKNLDELIAGPATVKGRPIASQFVMNLTLQTSLREDGRYDAKFAYVSTSPVPSGSWYWANLDGHRLALANRNSYNSARHYYPFRNLFREEPDFHRQNSTLPGPTPLTHDTAPAPHPNPGK